MKYMWHVNLTHEFLDEIIQANFECLRLACKIRNNIMDN